MNSNFGVIKSVTIPSIKYVEMEVNVLEKCTGRYFETKIESLTHEGAIFYNGVRLEIIIDKYNKRVPFLDFIVDIERAMHLNVTNYSRVSVQLMELLTSKTFK